MPVVVVAHSCLGTWWRAVRGAAPWPDDFAWRIDATAAGLREAAAVIAPSQAHADLLRAVYGPLDVAVVHNGTAPRPPGAGPRDRAVLTAGRLWDEAKGAALLDRIAPGLGAPLRAAGSLTGPHGEHAAFAALDCLGALSPERMAAEYGRATVFVSAAAYEPFGLAVLEAAQSGLRLVLLDSPGFRELWGGAAIFAAADDLQPALRAALDQPGDGGARNHAARYTVDRMVEGTLAVHGPIRRAA